jgi:glyoxylase-like metal-dependent hydrolase (beta-lactamase superfamily II)
MAGPFDVKWIHGSADCALNSEPPLHVHAFDDNTVILRENKCLNYEGNFIYLLFGQHRALLLDTGSEPQPHHSLPLRKTVDDILNKWLTAHHRPSTALVVAHTHSHLDHVFADYQFASRPDTVVVKPSLPAIQNFFNLADWPNHTYTLDLGGRALTIIPTPGHEQTHLSIYDEQTKIMFTGDMLYAGLLTVDDWPAYRLSAERLAQFAATHSVAYVLGSHIEMKQEPRSLYPIGTTYQPQEHVLQLGPQSIFQLRDACEAMGDNPHRDVHDEFIIYPE